jgi:hypothetical protein
VVVIVIREAFRNGLNFGIADRLELDDAAGLP